MNSKFSVSMVCATVVLILSCLAILPSTVDCLEVSLLSDLLEVVIGHKSCCKQAARETAKSESRKGIDMIFKTIENELAKVLSGNKNYCEKTPAAGHDSSDIETGHTVTLVAWTAVYNFIFDQIPSNRPMLSSKIRKAAITTVECVADAIYMGITAASSNPSSTTLIEVRGFENETACRCRKGASKIYADMRVGQELNPQTQAALDSHHNKAISHALLATHNTFRAIQILLDVILGETEAGSRDNLSSIPVLLEKARVQCRKWVNTVFDSIELLD